MKETPTLTHHQQHHTPPDLPDDTIPPQRTDPDPATEPLAAYIRRIVDTAPPPTPAQLQRLAGLLRDTSNPHSHP
jgi:hypothetical protein